MAVTLTQSFTLEAPRDLAWGLLTDPRRIVGCLPGAALTGRVDDRTYEGTMTVKVGPVTGSYRGRVRFERMDAGAGELELYGQGQETKGKGSADLRMRCRIQAAGPGRSRVDVSSEVTLTGMLAQFGRGMLEQVANGMLQSFTAQVGRVVGDMKAKYAEIVKTHAAQFARLFGDKVGALSTAAGFSIGADGSNGAASEADVLRYLEAVRTVGGDVSFNSARLSLRNAAQREGVPLSGPPG